MTSSQVEGGDVNKIGGGHAGKGDGGPLTGLAGIAWWTGFSSLSAQSHLLGEDYSGGWPHNAAMSVDEIHTKYCERKLRGVRIPF